MKKHPNHHSSCICSNFINCGIAWSNSSLGRKWQIYSSKLHNFHNTSTSIKELHAALLEKVTTPQPYEFW